MFMFMFPFISLCIMWFCFGPLSRDFLLKCFLFCMNTHVRLRPTVHQTPSPTSLTKIPICKARGSALPQPCANSACSYNKTSSLVEPDGPRPSSTGPPRDFLSVNKNLEKVRKGLRCKAVSLTLVFKVELAGLPEAYPDLLR